MPRPTSALVALAACSLMSGCAAVFVSAGPSLDASTAEIHDRTVSLGQHLSVGFQAGDDGGGVGGALHVGLLGYPDSGDGDPILQTVAEVRQRRLRGDPSRAVRPFYAFGAGVGAVSVLAGSVDPSAGALTVHGEVGVQYFAGRALLYLSAREQPALWVGSDALFVNSLQVSLGVGYRAGG